jgi:hypothetical protein
MMGQKDRPKGHVGLGINGQGIIDIPWLVVCDLTNNPPSKESVCGDHGRRA